jgi:hypothetical protein
MQPFSTIPPNRLICVRPQAGHVHTISRFLLNGMAVSGALELGAELVFSAAPIPGLMAVFMALRGIHKLASDLKACDKEAARLMVYCAAMTKALTPVADKLQSTPELDHALKRAATALEALLGIITARQEHGAIQKLFTSQEFHDAAEAARQEVEAAVRGVMNAALVQGVVYAAETNGMVELLLQRRSVRCVCPVRAPASRICSTP